MKIEEAETTGAVPKQNPTAPPTSGDPKSKDFNWDLDLKEAREARKAQEARQVQERPKGKEPEIVNIKETEMTPAVLGD